MSGYGRCESVAPSHQGDMKIRIPSTPQHADIRDHCLETCIAVYLSEGISTVFTVAPKRGAAYSGIWSACFTPQTVVGITPCVRDVRR